ncbi:Scarecrow-like protein 1 [Dioscorea alata]|uniref:Scarecrow-like protein 1 n=4 Tax=Dioscorea alata TaxID=55571 RepID=A0ACB7VZX4_DIOAL|nr:Scarecrow-like protein 1 [Dioscorea alata]KAH7680812.1 Scarecrow-like protein 1 [Dioscorea alata]KAH7680813.1 Scarecrow-like protein 1 [Dioscorea alata]
MSVIRSADSSSTAYGNSNIYARRSSGDNSGLNSQMLNSDKRMFNHYGLDTSHPEIYSHQYFNSSLSPAQHNLFHGSNSGVPGTMIRSQVTPAQYQLLAASQSPIVSENPYSACFSAVRQQDSPLTSNISHQSTQSVSDSQTVENDLDFDEDVIRLKLQELERALLADNDDELVAIDQEMSIDDDWSEPIKNAISPNSPKESSSDSNLSSTDSSREARTPKQLLFDCAAAISEGHMEEASGMITELRQMVSIQGDPPQRLAAYMVEGLAARMASSGQGLYRALKCKEPPTSDRLSAMQILFEVCPCFKFGFMAANGAIAEAFKDEEKVHIIDFDINQGSQYITLIQALSNPRSKAPRLRITGVDDPESVQRAVGGLKVIGKRLEELAKEHGVQFEFRAIAAKTGDVTPSMLDCRPGEALVVNFAFQLHHMPDESVSTVNQRDRLLRMVKGLNPKLVTVVEQDVNTNTAPFFPRFVEVYNYYAAVFESLDATLPRSSPDRMNVERQCLARDIVNIVACEGADRIERYEAAGKWRARMMMAGFVSCPLSTYVNGAIRSLLKPYCDRYKVKEEGGALYFGWEDKILVVASAWK